MPTIQTYGKSTPIPNGDHVYFEQEADARTNRRMYIENGHAVSLIAGEGDGYGFDVYDLWTEREAWGLDDPDVDAKLHRGEFEAPEADPAEADPAEAESVFHPTAMICIRCGRPVIWHTIARGYFHDNGWTSCDHGGRLKMPPATICPLHGADCEAWA